MSDGDSTLTDGLAKLVGSQVFTRLATFGLNQAVTRALSVEAYGCSSQDIWLDVQDRPDGQRAAPILLLSSLCIPLGILTTLVTCWFFGPREGDDIPGHQTAIILQGVAALLELASEPLYILAQCRLLIGLRVKIEAAATIAKIVATLGLIWSQLYSEAIALSVSQIIYAAVLLVGYSWHFCPEALVWFDGTRTPASTAARKQPISKSKKLPSDRDISMRDVTVCGSFTAQAFEKLLLAEGTKIAMTRVQAAYDQGVYGLVVNLGSVVVRTLFQPVEEAAFLTFSQPLGEGRSPFDRLSTLLPLLRVAILAGSVASVFGPSNTYLLLHLLYGPKYSLTEAPTALALYSPYVLLLAANGILECFVHAVATGPELWQGHVALLVITAAQTAVTLLLVASHGTLGMIAADGLGMLLRIGYCVLFIQSRLKKLKSKGPNEKLSRALPSRWTFVVLFSAGLASAMSAAFFLDRGPLAGRAPRSPELSVAQGAVFHIGAVLAILSAAIAAVYRTERPLWLALRQLRRKQD